MNEEDNDDLPENIFRAIDSGTATARQRELYQASLCYSPEAYFTEGDRDAGAGATAMAACHYVPGSAQAAERLMAPGRLFGCGYALGHPRYEEMIALMLPIALEAVVKDLKRAWKMEGIGIGRQALLIGRVNYMLQVHQETALGSGIVNVLAPQFTDGRPPKEVNATVRDLLVRIREMLGLDSPLRPLH